MRIISFIHDKSVIRRILSHLGIDELPEEHALSPPPEPAEVPLVYEPFFHDLSTPEEQMELAQLMS